MEVVYASFAGAKTGQSRYDDIKLTGQQWFKVSKYYVEKE